MKKLNFSNEHLKANVTKIKDGIIKNSETIMVGGITIAFVSAIVFFPPLLEGIHSNSYIKNSEVSDTYNMMKKFQKTEELLKVYEKKYTYKAKSSDELVKYDDFNTSYEKLDALKYVNKNTYKTIFDIDKDIDIITNYLAQNKEKSYEEIVNFLLKDKLKDVEIKKINWDKTNNKILTINAIVNGHEETLNIGSKLEEIMENFDLLNAIDNLAINSLSIDEKKNITAYHFDYTKLAITILIVGCIVSLTGGVAGILNKTNEKTKKK